MYPAFFKLTFFGTFGYESSFKNAIALENISLGYWLWFAFVYTRIRFGRISIFIRDLTKTIVENSWSYFHISNFQSSRKTDHQRHTNDLGINFFLSNFWQIFIFMNDDIQFHKQMAYYYSFFSFSFFFWKSKICGCVNFFHKNWHQIGLHHLIQRVVIRVG